MPATLLLAASAAASQYPILSALTGELWAFAIAFIGTIVTVTIYLRKERQEKLLRLAKEAAEEKTADAAWKKGVEESMKLFMPKEDARKEMAKLDHATGENKIAIGQVSVTAEKSVNAVHEELSVVKNQLGSFVGIPSELNTTKMEVKLLASEFKHVVSKVDSIQQEVRAQGEKQERASLAHYEDLKRDSQRQFELIIAQMEKNAETRGQVNNK